MQINNLKNAVKKNQLMSPRAGNGGMIEATPRIIDPNAIIFMPGQGGPEEAKVSPFKQIAGNANSQGALASNKSTGK